MGWQRGLPVLLGLAEGLYPFYWGLQGMYGGFCQFYWGLLGMRGGFTGIPVVCTNFTGIWGPHMGKAHRASCSPRQHRHLPPASVSPKPPLASEAPARDKSPQTPPVGGMHPKKYPSVTFLALSHQLLELLRSGAGTVPLLLRLRQPPAQAAHLHPQLLLGQENGARKGLLRGDGEGRGRGDVPAPAACPAARAGNPAGLPAPPRARRPRRDPGMSRGSPSPPVPHLYGDKQGGTGTTGRSSQGRIASRSGMRRSGMHPWDRGCGGPPGMGQRGDGGPQGCRGQSNRVMGCKGWRNGAMWDPRDGGMGYGGPQRCRGWSNTV